MEKIIIMKWNNVIIVNSNKQKMKYEKWKKWRINDNEWQW